MAGILGERESEMNKTQREIYQVLANEVGFILCGFCKYAVSIGTCCNGDIDCKHPLIDKTNFENEVNRAMNLGDCWGFRPRYPISFIANIVGIILANDWESAIWWQDEQGVWKVAGLK